MVLLVNSLVISIITTNKNIPDACKKGKVLPDIGKKIEGYMGHWNWEPFVKIVHPVVQDKFSHKYSQAEKKKIQTG
jgi:hypothetical protein